MRAFSRCACARLRRFASVNFSRACSGVSGSESKQARCPACGTEEPRGKLREVASGAKFAHLHGLLEARQRLGARLQWSGCEIRCRARNRGSSLQLDEAVAGDDDILVRRQVEHRCAPCCFALPLQRLLLRLSLLVDALLRTRVSVMSVHACKRPNLAPPACVQFQQPEGQGFCRSASCRPAARAAPVVRMCVSASTAGACAMAAAAKLAHRCCIWRRRQCCKFVLQASSSNVHRCAGRLRQRDGGGSGQLGAQLQATARQC
jgi:hypothetical protein